MTTDLAPSELWDATFVITTPPMTTIPAGLLGDFNDDETVDAADYVLWRKNNGGATALLNDGGLGTPIGVAHFDLWREHFGETLMPGSAGGTSVPEPGTIALVALGIWLFTYQRAVGRASLQK